MDEIKESGSVVLEGSDVADAQGGAIQNQNTSAKEYVVSLTLTSDGENSGKTKFAEATKNNVGKQIAIVYDNNIISAPNVNEEISGKYELGGFVLGKLIPNFTNLVFLFMMVSGFGMCCGYYQKIIDRKISVEEFYSKRYIKI